KDILTELESQNIYILCDPILKKIGVIKNLTSILEEANTNYILSTNVMVEPTVDKGNEIIEEVRENDIDLVIGLGGGSTIDLAKAAALLAPQKGMVENYLNLTGDKTLENKKIP